MESEQDANCRSMKAETWNQYISLTDSEAKRVNYLIGALLSQQLDDQR